MTLIEMHRTIRLVALHYALRLTPLVRAWRARHDMVPCKVQHKKESTMTRVYRSLLALGLALMTLAPITAMAGPITPPPLPITGPRMTLPIPIPSNDLLVYAPLTINALEADAFDGGRRQEAPGRGIRQTATGYGAGLTLYDSPNVCNNFNPQIGWAASDGNPDIWTDWYSGWAPFALNDGEYRADTVAFSRERIVGPGNRFDETDQNSVKIYSGNPYAAGFGSPRIAVPAGFEGGRVTVSVRYLIWDHDQGAKLSGGDGIDYDWASLGVKPGADGPVALYTNGYVRGEWSEMINTIDLGEAKDIMVLIQAQSPAFLNSNIYFDDVKIAFHSPTGQVRYLQDCTAEEAIR